MRGRLVVDAGAGLRWMMGQLRRMAVGNIRLSELAAAIRRGDTHE